MKSLKHPFMALISTPKFIKVHQLDVVNPRRCCYGSIKEGFLLTIGALEKTFWFADYQQESPSNVLKFAGTINHDYFSLTSRIEFYFSAFSFQSDHSVEDLRLKQMDWFSCEGFQRFLSFSHPIINDCHIKASSVVILACYLAETTAWLKEI